MGLSDLGSWFGDMGNIAPYLASGAGAVAASLFLRRKALDTKLAELQATDFHEAIKGLLADGEITYLEYYKASNAYKIAKLADEKIKTKKSKQVENKSEIETDLPEISRDFVLRFFEAAANVNDEYMQEIWARVFAYEAENPNYFSCNTLSTLASMNAINVNDFIDALNGCYNILNTIQNIDEEILLLNISNSRATYRFSLCNDGFIKLADIGLFRGPFEKKLIDGGAFISNSSYGIRIIENKNIGNDEIYMAGYTLTGIGKKISKLFELESWFDTVFPYEQSNDHLIDLSRRLRSFFHHLNVTLVKVNFDREGKRTFKDIEDK